MYHKFINNFPQNLKILECGDDFYYINLTKIPNTIKKLKLLRSIGSENKYLVNETIILPKKLEVLVFDYDDDCYVGCKYLYCLIKLFDNLPNNLRILQIPNFWNYPLINLPLKLEEIYIGSEFNQELNYLP